MTESLRLYNIILYSLFGASVVLFLLFFFGSEPDTALRETYIGLMLNWGYVLSGISVTVLVLFGIRSMVLNFRAARTSIIGILVLLVVFAIGWAMSSGDAYRVGQMEITEMVSRRSEAGIITFYVLMALAVLTIIYTEISQAFK